LAWVFIYFLIYGIIQKYEYVLGKKSDWNNYLLLARKRLLGSLIFSVGAILHDY